MGGKTFELIEKMYSDLTKRFDKMDNKIDTMSNQFTLFENDLKPKVETALEGYKVVYEKLNTLERKVDNINSKVEKQEVEIRVIKGCK